jgi:hypothetical protein
MGPTTNAKSQTRESEVKLAERPDGLGGIVGLLVGIGITALLWFLLSHDLAFGDPPPDVHPIRDSWFCRGPVSSDSDERVNGEAGWRVGRRMGVSAPLIGGARNSVAPKI